MCSFTFHGMIHIPGKGKVVSVLFWAPRHEGILGSGCIAPRMLDLGTRRRWLVSFTPRSLYSLTKSPWYPLNRRLGGPQSRSTHSRTITKLEDYRFEELCLVTSFYKFRSPLRSQVWEYHLNTVTTNIACPRILRTDRQVVSAFNKNVF
jgi:hypothetical protein